MITIFLTPDVDSEFGSIYELKANEADLVHPHSRHGKEGVWWHRNLGKAKECIRQRKAKKINALKLEILNVKRMDIKVVKI